MARTPGGASTRVLAAVWLALALALAPRARAGEPIGGDPFTVPQGAYQATFVRDVGHLTHMEFAGDYDKTLPGGLPNAPARAVVAREFFRTHPDQYDFLVTFTTFEFQTGDAVAFALPVQNHVQGIGKPIFDNSSLFGSGGKLKSFIEMAAASRYQLNPLAPEYEFVLGTLAHETLHTWGINVRYAGPGGQPSNALLGKDAAHWSFLLDTAASVEYGHRWRNNGNGSFTAVDARRFYSPLDLYLMGLYAPSEVPDFFRIQSGAAQATELPRKGAQIPGSAETISINQVIAVEGPRIPDAAASQKDFHYAFILLTPPGEEPSPQLLAQLEGLRREWAIRFSVLTGGRGRAHVAPAALPLADPGSVAPITGGPLRTTGASIPAALDWLRPLQAADGSFGDRDGTRVRDTAEALRALAASDPSFAGAAAARTFLLAQLKVNTDSLARAVRALGRGASPQQVTELAGRQNADGGWGLNPGLRSEALDTALATLALYTANPSASGIPRGVTYLKSRQNPDGGWPAGEQGPSSVLATAHALVTLGTLGGNGAIEPALQFLAARQNADGGFGVSGSSVHETSLVIQGLIAVNATNRINLTAARGFLDGQQSQNGSFSGSTYSTALALTALLSVDFPNWILESLTANPTALRDGERSTLQIVVRNDGRQTLPGGLVRIFEGQPGAGGVALGDRTLPPLASQEATQLSFVYDSFDRPGGRRLFAVVDPFGVVAERSELDNARFVDLQVSPAPPGVELELTSADLTAMPPNPSTLPVTLGIVANLRNAGMTAASGIHVQLWRGLPGASGSMVVGDSTVNVPSRSNTVVTFSTTLAAAGTTTYYVLADTTQAAVEDREDNNAASLSVTTSASVDLSVTANEITFQPSPALLGSDVVFQVPVRNRGTLTAPAAQVRYAVTGPNGFFQVLQTNSVTLDAGQSVTHSVVWRADRTGSFNFTAEVDVGNVVPELSETNNQASVPFTVQVQAGTNLKVDARDLSFVPDPALEGSAVTLRGVVTNAGLAAASNVEVAFFDGNPAAGGVRVGTTVLSSVAGQASVPVSVVWPNVSGANDRLIYIQVDPSSQIAEYDENDNRAFAPLVVRALPDLAISSGSLRLTPNFPRAGQSLTLAVEVANLGEQTASSVVVRAYAGDPSAGGSLIGTRSLGALAAGGTATATFTHSLPNGVTAQRLFVLVDPDGAVVEGDESNNRAERSIALQTGNAFVTEPYISPDGDGVRDGTVFFFAVDTAQRLEVRAVDASGEVARRGTAAASSDPVLDGQFEWDGRSDAGAVVADGDYRLQAVTAVGEVVAEAAVTVDTNRSPLLDALGTRAALFTDLTKRLGTLFPGSYLFSPDDELIYFNGHESFGGQNEVGFPQGIYRAYSDGSGVTPLVRPSDVTSPGNGVGVMTLSPDGGLLVFLAGSFQDCSYYTVRTDGTQLRQLNTGSACYDRIEFADADTLVLARGSEFPEADGVYLYRLELASGDPPVDAGFVPGSFRQQIHRLQVSGTRAVVQIFDAVYRNQSQAWSVDLATAAVALIGQGATWSHAGDRLAVIDAIQGKLRILDPLGALIQETPLGVQAYPTEEGFPATALALDATWSDDDRRIAFELSFAESNFSPDPRRGGLYVVDLATGRVERRAALTHVPVFFGGGGSFHVYGPRSAGVEEIGVLHFEMQPQRLELSLPELQRSASGELTLRIEQVAQEEAEVDQIEIVDAAGRRYAPARAVDLDVDESVAGELLKLDQRVADAHGRTFEVTWSELPGSGPLHLAMVAREASPSRYRILPLSFPSRKSGYMYELSGSGSLRVDGVQSAEEAAARPLFAAVAHPETGHPRAPVLGYVADDGQYLYAALDFGVDNVRSARGDWAAVNVRTAGSAAWRSFRMDAASPEHGAVGFQATHATAFPHKYYEFKLPLAELGVGRGSRIELQFQGYGSAGLFDRSPFRDFTLHFEDGLPTILRPSSGPDSPSGRSAIEWLPGSRDLVYKNPILFEQVAQQFLGAESQVEFNPSRDSYGAAGIALPATAGREVRAIFPERFPFDIAQTPRRSALEFMSRSFDDDFAYQEHLHTFRSLLNLTLDLRTIRSGAGIRLEGTASDAHLAEYRLEYREVADGSLWKPIAPPATAPVVDGLFGTWVPPTPGSFFVRLRATDLAGNTRSRIRRVSSSDTASISDVVRDEPYVSPNGDGSRDVVTLSYVVRSPANLVLEIYDENGRLIRTLQRSEDTIGATGSFSWDGRDALGFAVADGEYRLVLQGVEFVVTVDRSAPSFTEQSPDLFGLVGPKGAPCNLNSDGVCTVALQPEYAALLREANLASLVLESRPRSGGSFAPDTTSAALSVSDVRGDRLVRVTPRQGSDLVAQGRTALSDQIDRLTNRDYRLRARDLAGNESILPLASARKRDRVIVTHDGNQQNNDVAENVLADPAPFQPVEVRAAGRGEPSRRPRPLRISVVETLAGPVQSAFLEYRRVGQTTFTPLPLSSYVFVERNSDDTLRSPALSLAQRSDHHFHALFDPAALDKSQPLEFRVRLVVAGGAEHTSNVFAIRFAEQLSLVVNLGRDFVNGDATPVRLGFEVPFALQSAALSIASTTDPAFQPPRAVDAVDASEAPQLATGTGEVQFAPQPLKACNTYLITATVQGAGGTRTVQRSVRFQCFEVRLDEPKPVAPEQCGVASNRLRVQVGVVNENREDFALTQLALGVDDGSGTPDVFFNVVRPEAGTRERPRVYEAFLDTTAYADGERVPLLAQLTNDVGDTVTRRVDAKIDHRAPEVAISYPSAGQTVCASELRALSRAGGVEVPVRGVVVEGTVLDRQQGYDYPASATSFTREAQLGAGERVAIDDDDLYPTYRRAVGGQPVEIARRRVTAAGNVSAGGNQLVVETPSSGDYTVRLEVVDGSTLRTCVARSFTVDAVVDGASALPLDGRFVSPNGDGVSDTYRVQVGVGEPSELDIEVFRARAATATEINAGSAVFDGEGHSFVAQGPAVATLVRGFAVLPGDQIFEWNGQLAAGGFASDGDYLLQVTARDGCVNRFVRGFALTVDATPPSVQIAYPLAGQPIPLAVELAGTAADANLSSYRVSLAAAASPLAELTLASGRSSVVQGRLGTWNTFGLDGAFVLRLAAVDRAGNAALVSTNLTLAERTDLLSSFEVIEDIFSPNGDGRLESAQLRFSANEAIVASVEVRSAQGAFVRSLASDASYTAGATTVLWNGRDASGNLLPDGVYQLRVTARSAANAFFTQTESATVILDATAPVAELSGVVDGFLQSPELPRVRALDPHLLSYQVTLRTVGSTAPPRELASGDTPVDALPVAIGSADEVPDGRYVLRVLAVDAGDIRTQLETEFVLDRSPPVVTLTAPADGTVLRPGSEVVLTGSIQETNLADYRVLLRDASGVEQELALRTARPSGSELARVTLPARPDGSYVLEVRARDRGGRLASAARSIVLDATAPQVQIASPLDGGFVRPGSAITGSVADANLEEFELRFSLAAIDDVTRASSLLLGSAPRSGTLYTWDTPPADGAYRLYLSATDRAGTKALTSVRVTVDRVAPAAPVIQSAAATPQRSVALAWSASTESDLAGYLVFRNGVQLTAQPLAQPTYTDPSAAEGVYRYEVSAVDRAGNQSVRSAAREVRVDTTAPDARIDVPAPGAAVGGGVDIRGTASSEGDFKEYRVYAGAQLLRRSTAPVISGELAQWETLGAGEGSFTIRLEAEDTSGNVRSTSVQVTVDNRPPSAPTNLQASVSGGNDVALSWSASPESDVVGYLLFRDDRLVNASGPVIGSLLPYVISATSYSDVDVPDGDHRYRVFALDRAENQSSPSNAAMVSIDTRAPDAQFVRPQSGDAFDQVLEVAVESADTDVAQVVFELRAGTSGAFQELARDTAAPFVQSFSTTSLVYGTTYQLRATATDRGGRVDATPALISVTRRDLLAPAPATNLSALVNGEAVTLSWTASTSGADVAAYEVTRTPRVDGVYDPAQATLLSNATPTATTFVDTVGDGFYRYSVVARDAAGNRSAEIAVSDVRVFSLLAVSPYTPTTATATQLSVQSPVAGALSVSVTRPSGVQTLAPLAIDADTAIPLGPFALESGDNAIALSLLDAAGNRSRTTVLVVVRGAPPTAPTGLATSVSGSDVALHWNANPEPNVVGYRLLRDGADVLPLAPLAFTTATTALTPRFGSTAAVVGSDTGCALFFRDGVPGSIEVRAAAPALLTGIQLDWVGPQYLSANLDVLVWSGDQFVPVAQARGTTITDQDSQQTLPFAQPYYTDRVRIDFLSRPVRELGLCDVSATQRPLISGTSYTDAARPDGTYSYTLRAWNDLALESAGSAPASASVGDVTPPAAVTLAGSVSGSNVSLSWNRSSSSDVVRYDVLRNGASVGSIVSDGRATYTFAETVRNGSHAYTVRAIDAVGLGSSSNTFTALVAVAVSAAPQGLTAITDAAGRSISLSWTPAPGSAPTAYAILRSADGGPFQQIAVVTGTSYVDRDVQYGVEYRYVVRALDALQNASADSNSVATRAVDTFPPAPPTLTGPAAGGQVFATSLRSLAFSGRAEPNSQVTLFRDEVPVAQGAALAQSRVETVAAGTSFAAALAPSTRGRDDVAIFVLYSGVSLSTARIYDARAHTVLAEFPTSFPDAFAPDLAQRRVFYVEGASGDVVQVDLETGTRATLDLGPDAHARGVYLMPSGDRLLVDMEATSGGQLVAGLWLHDLATGTTQPIHAEQPDVGNLSLSPDGRRAAFVVGGTLRILDLSNGSFADAPGYAGGGYHDLDWSPDSRRLVLTSGSAETRDLALLDATSLQLTPLPSTPEIEDYPVFSADGASLGFVRSDGFRWQVVVRNLADGAEQVTYTSPVALYSLSWTRSNLLLTFREGAELVAIEPPGAFHFPSVALVPGDQLFEAVAVDAFDNESPPSARLQVVAGIADTPDLSVQLAVVPALPYVGSGAELQLRVRNEGGRPAPATDLDLLLIAPDGSSRTFLATQPIAGLAPGEELQLRFGFTPDQAGDHYAVAAVDARDRIGEASRTNNSTVLAIPVSASATPTLGLFTSAESLPVDSQLQIDALLRNPGGTFRGTLRVSVADLQGNLVSAVDERAVALATGESRMLQSSFATARTFAGPYLVIAQLLDAAGAPIASASTPLAILADERAAIGVASDRAAYADHELVRVTAAVQRLAGNSLLEGTTARFRVLRGAAEVFAAQAPVGSLLPDAQATLRFAWDTGASAPDRYLLAVELRRADGSLLASATTPIDVVAGAPRITGSVSAARSVPVRDPIAVSFRAQNSGNTALSGVQLRFALRSTATLAVVQSQTLVRDLPLGSDVQGSLSLPTLGLPIGGYQLELSADTTFQGAAVHVPLAGALVDVVDASAPLVALAFPADGATINGLRNAARIEARDFESAVARVEASVDGGAFAPVLPASSGVYAVGLDALGESTHTLAARAFDFAGNVSGLAGASFLIDNTPPVVTVSGVQNQAFYAAPVTPVVQASDLHAASLSLTLDGAPFASGTSVSSEGSHTLLALATDAAGNTSGARVDFVIDRTAPVLTLTGVANGGFYNTDVAPTVTATDANLVLVELLLNGAPVVSGTTLSAEGSYALSARARDAAGNESTLAASFRIDRTPPVLTLTGVVNGGLYSTPVTPTLTATDANLVLVELLVNGAPFVSGTTLSTDGSYALSARARDAAGNESTLAASFRIDRTPPVLTLTGVADGGLYNTPVAPTLSATDANLALVELLLNGAPFVSGTTLSADGSYALSARATDAAGNESTLAASFRIDRTSPAAPLITSHAEGATVASSPITLQGATEAGALVTLTQPSGARTATADAFGGFQFTGVALTDGANTLRFVSRDAAGNDSPEIVLHLTLSAPTQAAGVVAGTASWRKIGSTRIELTLQTTFRRELYTSCVRALDAATVACTGSDGLPAVGDLIAETRSGTSFDWGDGSARLGTPATGGALLYRVTAVDFARSLVSGIALERSALPNLDGRIEHVYPATPASFVAALESGARASLLANGVGQHVNNAGVGFRVETKVDLTTGGSPVTGLPPVVRCPSGGVCSFPLPAADPDGDRLTFRLALPAEAKATGSTGSFAQPGPTRAPNAATLNATSGVFSWNSSGAAQATQPGARTLYSAQLVVDDGRSRVALEFLIELVPGNLATTSLSATSGGVAICGNPRILTLETGEPLAVALGATDSVAGSQVRLQVAGRPLTATLTPQTPVVGNPAASQLAWTPTSADLGLHVLTFHAESTGVGFAQCPAIVRVIPGYCPADPANDADHDGTCANARVYISDDEAGMESGVHFANEDIVTYDEATGSYAMFFDGSDVGLKFVNVDALHVTHDAQNSLLISIDDSEVLPGVGLVDDEDIVRFIPTSLGDNTAGTFEMYFDGSDVGFGNYDDLTSLSVLPDGRLVIGTSGLLLSGVYAAPEDLLIFTPTSLGTNTAGSFAMYLRGADQGISSSEGVDALWVEAATDHIHMSTRKPFSVPGLSGFASDVFRCEVQLSGMCEYRMVFDGSENSVSFNDIDALHIDQ